MFLKLEDRLTQLSGKNNLNQTFSYDNIKDELRVDAQKILENQIGYDSDRTKGKQKARGILLPFIEEQHADLPRPLVFSLLEELLDDLLGYGPLEPFFNDPEVTEIIVARWDHIRVEKNGIERRIESGFRDEQHCRDVLDRMLAPTSRSVDYSNHRVSARLPDGSRLMGHVPPITVDGTQFAIRRFRAGLTPGELVARGVCSEEIMQTVGLFVKGALNIFVSGGTSSGKTTLLNAFASFIPEEESLITIEDPAEMILQHSNVRRWEVKPPNIEGKGAIPASVLIADALRARPKRILMGECRAGEAFDVLQAMNSGHPGSMSTAHSNSAEETLNTRLPNMIQMADMGLPYEAVVHMIASSVDIVVHVKKDPDGTRRINHINQVIGTKLEEGSLRVDSQRIFEYDYIKKIWVKNPVKFQYTDRLLERGLDFVW